jgi:hypothetical protein
VFALRSSRRNAAQVPCTSLRSGRGPTGTAEYRPAPTTRLVAITPATGNWPFDEPLLRRLGPRCRLGCGNSMSTVLGVSPVLEELLAATDPLSMRHSRKGSSPRSPKEAKFSTQPTPSHT